MLEKISRNPKRIILIDMIGAMLSVILLSVVLVQYEAVFKIPKEMLYFLAGFPMIFIIFHVFSILRRDLKLNRYLKVISILNISYCLISLVCIFLIMERVSIFGLMYLILEINIVLILATIEFKVSKKLNDQEGQQNA